MSEDCKDKLLTLQGQIFAMQDLLLALLNTFEEEEIEEIRQMAAEAREQRLEALRQAQIEEIARMN